MEWRKKEKKTQVQVSLVNTKKNYKSDKQIRRYGKCYAPSNDKCCKKFYDRSSFSLFPYWALREFFIIRRPSINWLWIHTAPPRVYYLFILIFFWIRIVLFFFCFCECVYKTWAYSLYMHLYVFMYERTFENESVFLKYSFLPPIRQLAMSLIFEHNSMYYYHHPSCLS